jgi:hypothetical protein
LPLERLNLLSERVTFCRKRVQGALRFGNAALKRSDSTIYLGAVVSTHDNGKRWAVFRHGTSSGWSLTDAPAN